MLAGGSSATFAGGSENDAVALGVIVGPVDDCDRDGCSVDDHEKESDGEMLADDVALFVATRVRVGVGRTVFESVLVFVLRHVRVGVGRKVRVSVGDRVRRKVRVRVSSNVRDDLDIVC